MKEESQNITAEGIFFQHHVCVINHKEVVIYFKDDITKDNFEEFKPICDKIGHYLTYEGFVTVKLPRIRVMKLK